VILERVIYNWYQDVTHKKLDKPMLGPMLNDKEFNSKIPKLILPKLNYIKDYGNLGSHGEEIDSKTANDIVYKLLDVLEWFTTNPNTKGLLSHEDAKQSEAKIDNIIDIEILPQLKEEYPKCVKPDIKSVRFGQDEKSCYLIITTDKTIVPKVLPGIKTRNLYDQTVVRTDLGFIGEPGYDDDEDILTYDPKKSLDENARQFISDLGVIIDDCTEITCTLTTHS
jgi:hypothetical protein